MGETYSEIPEYLIEWIKKQQMFWVASAPLSADGHVNISPKGVAGTFHVESSTKVWYEDLSGSGAETIAHIRENGRITVLFNAFEGPPRILRLYGTGSFYEMGTPEYETLLPVGTRQPGSRAVVVVDVYMCGTTCGYSVPYYSFVGHRTPLLDWAARKEAIDLASSSPIVRPPTASSQAPSRTSSQLQGDGRTGGSPHVESDAAPHPSGLLSWWRDRNTYSLDGLPALDVAFRQSPSSLGHHQAVRKARQSALNAYPPSKQPVDEEVPDASDVRSRRPWAITLKLIYLVRWFILVQLLPPIITPFTVFVTRLPAKPDSAKAPSRTIRVHGEEIHERADDETYNSRPPVSWGDDDLKADRTSSEAGGLLLQLKATREPFDKGTNALRWLSSNDLLGHGVSFLLGVIFMVFYREVNALVSIAAHAAAPLSFNLAFRA